MLIVVAISSDTIIQRNQPLESHIQRESIRSAANAVAEIAKKHQVVLLHNCSAQQAMLALINYSYEEIDNFPVDIPGAQNIGITGFLFEQDLRNALSDQRLCTVSIHTFIDSNDEAFANPDVPVGQVFTYDEAQMLINTNPEWLVRPEDDYFRRVLPAPVPGTILELPSIRHLTSSGDITVICGDGGGKPMREDIDGIFHSVAAVIDQVQTASILAEGLEADGLIYLTDRPHVETVNAFGETQGIQEITPDEANQITIVDYSSFYTLESACNFVKSGGKFGGIGAVDCVSEMLVGTSGTFVKIHVPDGIKYYS